MVCEEKMSNVGGVFSFISLTNGGARMGRHSDGGRYVLSIGNSGATNTIASVAIFFILGFSFCNILKLYWGASSVSHGNGEVYVHGVFEHRLTTACSYIFCNQNYFNGSGSDLIVGRARRMGETLIRR